MVCVSIVKHWDECQNNFGTPFYFFARNGSRVWVELDTRLSPECQQHLMTSTFKCAIDFKKNGVTHMTYAATHSTSRGQAKAYHLKWKPGFSGQVKTLHSIFMFLSWLIMYQVWEYRAVQWHRHCSVRRNRWWSLLKRECQSVIFPVHQTIAF